MAAAAVQWTRPAYLLVSDLQHRGGEIDADDAPGAALTAHGRKREIGGARAEVQHGFTAGQLQRVDGLLAPSLVEPRAEQMIQEVVSLGDRIEHA